MEYKQAILIRADLKLPKGKLAAQAGHAAVDAVLKSDKEIVAAWKRFGQGKIVLKVADEKEMRVYLQRANNAKIVTALITDAGRTCVAPGTVTALGIGPDEESKIDDIVGDLKLL